MATKSQDLLCEAILEDYFGFYVKAVGHALMKASLTFRNLHKNVKKALAVLEMYELVSFRNTNRGVLYTINQDNILRFERIFRAIRSIKKRYGDLGEAIAEEVFAKGRMCYSKCADNLIGLLGLEPEQIKKTFAMLVSGQILKKCDLVDESDPTAPVPIRHPKPFEFSPLEVRETTSASGAKKRSHPDDSAEDLWRFNWQRVDRILRDELILDTIKRHEEFDPADSYIWSCLLQVADQNCTIESLQSDPIAVQEVCRWLSQETGKSHGWEDVDRRLFAVAKSSDTPIRRLGDSGDYCEAFRELCYNHVDSVILEKIDERAVRIFRLVRRHTNVEEDQLAKSAMLSSKEAKELSYALLECGFIHSRPIAKTNDFAPARTFYFYTHKMPELVDNMLLQTMDFVRNAIRRRINETVRNEVLLATEEKMDTIIASIQQDTNLTEEERRAQSQEVRAMYLTEEDKKNLDRHKSSQRRLHSTEISLEEPLFVFQMCRLYWRLKSKHEAAQLASKRRRRTVDVGA